MAVNEAPVTHPPFAFTGSILPTELSWAYRVGLVVVAAAMLLLPLVYLAVIVLAAAGVWWHLTSHAGWVTVFGNGVQFGVLIYAAPALAGTAITFFMIKPIFARRPPRREPIVLQARDHPELFAFIARICDHVQAPVPRSVHVDCQVNASAGFVPGWQSVLGRELVLTIGMPLVRALSVRQLGGVLAHEFGHFAQGSGLRLTMIVRGINVWFMRVVHERDMWDWRLDEWSKSQDGRVMVLLLPSRLGIWLSRQILKQLMVAGHVISSFMTRQMEYDADSYEVKIAGSDAFSATMRQLRRLNAAAASSMPFIDSELAAKRLPADLPLFLVTWLTEIPVADASEYEHGGRSRWFATHPSDDDRIAAAVRAADRGILTDGDQPAARLFGDLDALSQAATRHHYAQLGILEQVSLVDALDSVRNRLGRAERQAALSALFDHGISRFRPLKVPAPLEPALDAIAFESWRFPDALERFDDRMKQRASAFAAQEVWHAEYGVFDPVQFGLSEWTLDAAESAERDAMDRLAVLETIIEPYERATLQKLARGLERLGQSGDARYTSTALDQLVDAFNAMADAMRVVLDLNRLLLAYSILRELVATSPRPDATRARCERLRRFVDDAMARLRQRVAGAAYPTLLDGNAATLTEACQLGEGQTDPRQAAIAVETLYSTLLLEICWLALRGDQMEAPALAPV